MLVVWLQDYSYTLSKRKMMCMFIIDRGLKEGEWVDGQRG